MPPLKRLLLYAILAAASLTQGRAFQRADWRISPERINILVGEERTLQALDDDAQELVGVAWSINDPSRAVATEQDGRLSLRATKVGALRVTAALRGELRFLDVSIWADPGQIPSGTAHWGMHAIGRQLGDVAAVPTENGPNMLSLEQTGAGATYLRGTREDGIQIWAWHLPEKTKEVELICGDWLGGALIGANHLSDYKLYTVGSVGKRTLTRWITSCMF